MKVNIIRTGNVLIVRLEGELDMHTAEEFRSAVEESMEKSRVYNIILNLSKVTFIDSSGLGVILGRYRHLNQYNGKMVAVQANEAVRKLWELSGMQKIICLCDSEETALGKF